MILTRKGNHLNPTRANPLPLIIGCLTLGILAGVLGTLVIARDDTAPAAERVFEGVDKLTFLLSIIFIKLLIIGGMIIAF